MSIRQRLYPSPSSTHMLVKHCCDARFVYNLGPQQRNLWREERVPKVNTATQMRELAEARKAFDWLALGSSSVQQAALRDLDRAFQNWWTNPQHFHHLSVDTIRPGARPDRMRASASGTCRSGK